MSSDRRASQMHREAAPLATTSMARSNSTAADMGAPGVQFFFSPSLAKKHTATLKQHHAHVKKLSSGHSAKNSASDYKCPSCNSKGSCGNCITLNDGRDPCLSFFKMRSVYVLYDYSGWPAAPQLPVAGSQVLTTTDGNYASLINYQGVLPAVPAGQVQVVFPNALFLGPSTPSKAIIAINGVRSANGTGAATANLLNGLWRVVATDVPETWTLQRLSLNGYKVGFLIHAKIYRDSTTLITDVPVTETVEVTEINLPERVFSLALTNYGQIPLFVPLSVCGATEPRCCAYEKPKRCGQHACCAHNLHFSMVTDHSHVKHVTRNLASSDRKDRAALKRAMLRSNRSLPPDVIPSFSTWLASQSSAASFSSPSKQQQQQQHALNNMQSSVPSSAYVSAATRAASKQAAPVKVEIVTKPVTAAHATATVATSVSKAAALPAQTMQEKRARAHAIRDSVAAMRANRTRMEDIDMTNTASSSSSPVTLTTATARTVGTTPRYAGRSPAEVQENQIARQLRLIMKRGPIAEPNPDANIASADKLKKWQEDVTAVRNGILTGDLFSDTWTETNWTHIKTRLGLE